MPNGRERASWAVPSCGSGIPCGSSPQRGPQAAQHPAPAGAETPARGRFASLCPRAGEKRGEAAAGTQKPEKHGAGTGTGTAPHLAAGPAGGPAKWGGKKGDRDARRGPRADHPRRAARSAPQDGPADPRAFAGAAGTPFFGRPANWRGAGPNRRRPHPHQATPPATATTRPTPGRDKTRQFASGTARPGGAIPPGVRRPGRIPFKFRAQAPQWGRARNKRPRTARRPPRGRRARRSRQAATAAHGTHPVRTASDSSPTAPEAGE